MWFTAEGRGARVNEGLREPAGVPLGNHRAWQVRSLALTVGWWEPNGGYAAGVTGSSRSWKDPSGHIHPRCTDSREDLEDTMDTLDFTGPHLPAESGGVGLDFLTARHSCVLLRVPSLCWAWVQEWEDHGPPGDISRGPRGAR